MPKQRPAVRATETDDREQVHLNVKLDARLRREMRRRALDEGIPMKDWLARVLRQHLGQSSLSG